MSELKELVEKFIELDDDLNAKIEESLDDNDELPESFEAENEAQINEMGEIYHDIEHKVFDEEFIIVFNSNEDEKEVVALIVSDEDEDEEFVIPAFTDEEEANAAIEQFKEEFGDIDFECEIKTGSAIIADHHEDDGFIGLAINAPQWDFVIAHEDVHECCD